MRRRKHWLTINAAALIIHKVHKIWEDKKIASALLIDVKRIFDYVFWEKLVQRIHFDINNDLTSQTKSFSIDRLVELVIIEFTNIKHNIESVIC